jgi:Sugar phosphate isomerases/epimerases
MDLSVSNIALPEYHHSNELSKLKELGIGGIEVAPSRVWRDTWSGLKVQQVESYRQLLKDRDLEVVGLHSLLYDHKNLGLFGDKVNRNMTIDFLVHLSTVCRDLGGKTLVYGGGRWRLGLTEEEAFSKTLEFFSDLIPRIESHKTTFCFEPLAPAHSDFINSVNDSIKLVEEIQHPSLRVQLDIGALVQKGELDLNYFSEQPRRGACSHQ